MKPSITDSQTRRQSRRQFLQKSGMTAAALAATPLVKTSVYAQNQAPAAGRVLGANDRIVVAYVGVGKQGMTHVRSQKKIVSSHNIAQAAVCDVYDKHLGEARETLGLDESNGYRDHRKLLERKDIDAIVIAAVDNWHAGVAIDAMEAGKHVYGEKPLSRYIEEGFAIYDTVKKTGKVFQLGSQYCCDPKYYAAAKWIREGKIGPLVWAQHSYCRNKLSEWTYPIDPEASPDNLDWDRWQGRAPKKPWDPNRYFSWHKYFDYNSGILGNLLAHVFTPLMIATEQPEFPRRVVCTGTRKISTDREIPDTTHLLAEMPSGLTYCVAGSTVNEQGLPEMIRGQKATLYLAGSQNKVELKPERLFADEVDPETFTDPARIGDLSALEQDFFNCIRNGETPKGNIELAIRAHTILCLAEMSERMNLALLFDPKTRTITTGDGKVVSPLTYDTELPG